MIGGKECQYDVIGTARGEVRMVPATPDELDIVMDLVGEAGAWLVSRGINQWVPGAYPRDWVREGILAGLIHLARLQGEVMGCIRLQWEDEEIWGEAGRDGLAGYAHTLAIRRQLAGHGVGASLLRWAEGRAAQAGKTCLRLDCMAANPALRALYERQGYFLQQICRFDNGWIAALYQKNLHET